MTSCDVTVVNPLGLHARAAARFVHLASGFSCRVRVRRGDREMDGKSIMGLLLLSAAHGSVVTITTDGSDEADALAALCALVTGGFGESFDAAQDKPPDGARDKP